MARVAPPATASLKARLDYLIRTRLWPQIIVAMVAGITIGLLLSPSGGAIVPESVADTISAWLALPGHLLLALIQMVVAPLVLSSIIQEPVWFTS